MEQAEVKKTTFICYRWFAPPPPPPATIGKAAHCRPQWGKTLKKWGIIIIAVLVVEFLDWQPSQFFNIVGKDDICRVAVEEGGAGWRLFIVS